MSGNLDNMNVGDLWRMFRLRKWLFLTVVCVFTGVFTVGAYLIPNRYESSATILLEQKPIAETGVGTVKLTPDLDQRLRIFKTLVMSEYLLKKVIERLKLVPNLNDALSVQEKIDELRTGISVKIQESDSLQIFYQGKDPRLVMQITNELANFFLEDTLQYMEKSLGGTMRFLEEQLASTEAQLEEQEQKIMAFKAKHYDELPQHITGHQSSLDRLLLQVESLESQIRELDRQKKQAQLHLAELEASFGLVEQGKDANALLQQKLLKLEALKSENTPQHPDVIALEKEIASLEKALHEAPPTPSAVRGEQKGEVHPALAQSMEYQSLKQQILDLTSESARLEGKKPALQGKIQEHQTSLHAAHEREQEYVKLTRGYEVLKERYQSLFNKKLDAQLSTRLEQVQQEEKFQILDAATVPFEPIWPNRPLLAGIGFVVSHAMGLGLVFLLGFLDRRVHSPDQMMLLNPLPMLGAIPHFHIDHTSRSLFGKRLPGFAQKALPVIAGHAEEEGAGGPVAPQDAGSPNNLPATQAALSASLIMLKGKDWFGMEQYRQFRSSVKFCANHDQAQVFMVTSSFPGEGKTVTAANLAVALGLEEHQDVLLIDAELRKSQIHALFGLPQAPGLAELLAGQDTIEGVLRQGPVKRLSIMTAGHFQGNPADLFEKPDFKNLLKLLKQRFRYILLDSPPILAVADGRILSCLTDGVILVARAGVTREHSVQETLGHLKHAHVLGTVLNDIETTQFTHRYGEYVTSGYYAGSQR